MLSLDVAQPNNRTTPTLSISLTPELAEAIASRVRSGLYTSASELIREALRLYLKVEKAQEILASRPTQASDPPSSAAARFATTMELFDLGAALRAEKLRGAGGADDRLRALEIQQEAGPGLRLAPKRLKKLKVRGKG